MNILLFMEDPFEEQGIRWIIESHLASVQVINATKHTTIEEQFYKQPIDLVVIDLDSDEQIESLLSSLITQQLAWIGISSKRTFQTANKGLQYKAEAIIYRPFSSDELLTRIREFFRKKRSRARESIISSNLLHYEDFLLPNRTYQKPLLLGCFLTEQLDALQHLHTLIIDYPFSGTYQVFAFSNYVLVVHEQKTMVSKEEYRNFLVHFQQATQKSAALVVSEVVANTSLQGAYQQVCTAAEQLFYKGYDLVIENNKAVEWIEFDPFLTPLEQRQWIEMLEKRQVQTIRERVEQEFLTYEAPYPHPEMVRIRLTSVLAQIRRYMKSHQIHQGQWEIAYLDLFQTIVQVPVIHEIVRQLLAFVSNLLAVDAVASKERTISLVEKVEDLIETNYWDANWSLEECAEAVRMNKSTVSRRFALESGQTFLKVLHRKRIDEAKRLLLETELSIEEIAKLTGYTHQSYFNAKFKEVERQTPTAFRTGLKGKKE